MIGTFINILWPAIYGIKGPSTPPTNSFLLLANGTDFLLLADGSSKLILA